MKKLMISLLATVTIATAGAGIGTVNVQPQTAHASLLGKAFMITYLYKNRNVIKEMFNSAKTKAHTTGFPHFKAGASNGSTTQVYVVTKTKNHYIGAYPAKLVQMIASGDSDVKAELQKLGI